MASDILVPRAFIAAVAGLCLSDRDDPRDPSRGLARQARALLALMPTRNDRALLLEADYLEARRAVLALPGLVEAAKRVTEAHKYLAEGIGDRLERENSLDALRRAIEEASR